jgi:hypothetical protein
MSHIAVMEALAVLNEAQFRGVRCCHYDTANWRVVPESCNGRRDAAPPCVTGFAARAIAAGLKRIGAALGRVVEQ